MIDKIGGVGGLGPIRDLGDKQKRVEKSKGKLEGESLKAEHASAVRDLVEEVKRVNDVRAELVEEIKKAIESGKYVVNVENIARKLLGGG